MRLIVIPCLKGQEKKIKSGKDSFKLERSIIRREVSKKKTSELIRRQRLSWRRISSEDFFLET